MRQLRYPYASTGSAKLLAVFFVVAGSLHFLWPQAYARIVPPWVPLPLVMVWLSGACEIAGGLGVLEARWQRLAGLGLIALSLAVFPANVQMLLNAQAAHASPVAQTLLWLRLPMQLPLIYWIWRTTLARATRPALQGMDMRMDR
ncbi:DoxX family membrane protein [Uliginosibacterium sp. H3]|uniref:DoxX family membrane protein n=1 Tax=Uliginosibacterium silvisoli TaxID=3114758 RepID=A0ABU6JZQ6_9RHOO|nr:DoxX family membrane protein [Uliginosibacterium sp. H3]